MAKKIPLSNESSKLDRLDTFVLTGVVTILLTRSFLALSGYPQLGSDSLHVAHVLYGGAILVAAYLYLLLSNKPNSLVAAIIGGIGFGLFIDEIGKFVTQDNDYFFQPAIGLIYLSFLLIWFIARIIIVKSEGLPLFSPAEWPSILWQKYLILFWSTITAIGNVLLLPITLFFGIDAISTSLQIPRLGIFSALVYGVLLVYGLSRYVQHHELSAAHNLRGANIYGLVLVFPFYYLVYPVYASVLIIPTILVIIGLSEVSVLSLLKKLGAK